MGTKRDPTCLGEVSFEKIQAQLERILRYSGISHSDTLKSFLSFVVNKCLNGEEHCIKEYTIAVEVLKRGITFSPKDDCIVRIHGVRLRKILNEFYEGEGIHDEVMISLPKGHYVPDFSLRAVSNNKEVDNVSHHEDEKTTIAVVPFHFTSWRLEECADILGAELTNALVHMHGISVISYDLLRKFRKRIFKIHDLGLMLHTAYFLSGSIRREDKKLRIVVNLTRTADMELQWSKVIEKEFNPESDNYSGMQKELVKQILRFVRKWYQQEKRNSGKQQIWKVA